MLRKKGKTKHKRKISWPWATSLSKYKRRRWDWWNLIMIYQSWCVFRKIDYINKAIHNCTRSRSASFLGLEAQVLSKLQFWCWWCWKSETKILLVGYHCVSGCHRFCTSISSVRSSLFKILFFLQQVLPSKFSISFSKNWIPETSFVKNQNSKN